MVSLLAKKKYQERQKEQVAQLLNAGSLAYHENYLTLNPLQACWKAENGFFEYCSEGSKDY